MTALSRRNAEVLRAIVANINRMHELQPISVIHRRANGWSHQGYPAGSGDGRSSSGEHSDPTYAMATADRGVDYAKILNDAVPILAQVEQAMRELTRPEQAEVEERESTYQRGESYHHPNSGRCTACDEFCDGHDRRLIVKHGPPLCKTHATGLMVLRRSQPWLTTDDYIASVRAQRGLDLETVHGEDQTDG